MMGAMTFQEVGDRIFRRRYERFDQNIGVIVGTESVCVIDSRSSHPDADELRAELSTLTSLPVRFLVNTHMHWDHTFGNSRFESAAIVGHRDCRRRLVEDGDAMRSRLMDADWMPDEERPIIGEVEIVPPAVTFDTSLTLHLEDRQLDLAWLGRGHTDNDIVITIDEVCFVGDLVEEGAPPVFGDAYPSDWVATLGRVLEMSPPTVVPGHGDVVGREYVSDQRDSMERALRHLATGEGEAPWSEAVMASIAERM
jgi:glyoxylase-like metal-dependent hydrolase (beta-lactamase superfamily II)